MAHVCIPKTSFFCTKNLKSRAPRGGIRVEEVPPTPIWNFLDLEIDLGWRIWSLEFGEKGELVRERESVWENGGERVNVRERGSELRERLLPVLIIMGHPDQPVWPATHTDRISLARVKQQSFNYGFCRLNLKLTAMIKINYRCLTPGVLEDSLYIFRSIQWLIMTYMLQM